MNNSSLAEKEKPSLWKKIWGDPVWSKVIASIIFGCIGLLLAYFGMDQLDKFQKKPEITIRSHVNNSHIDRIISLDGYYANIPNKAKILVFLYTPGESKYYWRGVSVNKPKKTWLVSNLIVGDDKSKGDTFEIGVTMVEDGALANSDITNNIPAGVSVLEQIAVVRN